MRFAAILVAAAGLLASVPTLAADRALCSDWPGVGSPCGGGDGDRPLTLGIGSMALDLDGTNLAFDYARYLERKPLRVRGQLVKAYLVDYATDADLTVSGSVRAFVSMHGVTQLKAVPLILEIIGLSIGMVAAVAAVIGLALGVGALAVGAGLGAGAAFAITAASVLCNAASQENSAVYTSSASGTMKLRRGAGGPTRGVYVTSDSVTKKGLQGDAIVSRDETFEPFFSKLSSQIESELAAGQP